MTVTSTHEPLHRPHVFKRKSAVGVVTAAALALGGVFATSTSALAAETPSITADVTEVPNERIEVTIEGTGFGDVVALPGQSAPGAYLTVVEKDSDLSEVADSDPSISATIDSDGNFSDTLDLSSDELEEDADYEVISWPTRSFPTESNIFARTDIDIDWHILLDRESEAGDEEDENDEGDDEGSEDESPMSFTASASSISDDDQLEIVIAGSGFGDVQALPGQDGPGAYFTLIEAGADLGDVSQGDSALSASIDEDGNIEDVLLVDVDAVDRDKDYEVISWPTRSNPSEENLYGCADLEIDWDAFEGPVDEEEDENGTVPDEADNGDDEGSEDESPMSFTASASSISDDDQLEIAIAGSGFSEVQALPGQDSPGAYFTLIEAGADLSEVAQEDPALSASIDEDGNIEDVLLVDVDAVDRDTDYEVISWPTRSFPNDSNLYGRTDLEIDWDALEGPVDEEEDENGADPEEDDNGDNEDETPGEEDITVTVNGSSDASVRQGEDVTFSVAPVVDGTEFNVTVASDPIELDAVTADESNSASATWTVPEDFELGEHTVTFANEDVGAHEGTFTVVAAEAGTEENAGTGDGTGNGDTTDQDDENAAASTAGDQSGGTQGALATTGASITVAAIVALLMVVLGAMIVMNNRKRGTTAARNSSL